MEILIFVVILGFIMVQKVQKVQKELINGTDATDSEKDPEEKTTIFTFGGDRLDIPAPAPKVKKEKDALNKTSVFHKTKVDFKSSQVRPVQKPVEKKKTEQQPEDLHLKLHTHSEARKAFLYSEIFRRKYE